MFDSLLSPVGQIIALGVVGIVIWHLQGRRRPNARLVVQIAIFMLMTAVLLQSGLAPIRFEPEAPNGNLLVAAKTLWWVHLAWAVIGFLRLYLDLDGRPHEARLVQDLLVAAIYLGVGLAVLSFVFGIAIGTLLATSGVIAIILGLALQSTLNDVFSGVALTLGRPYAIGDWIMLADGTEGRVFENTWRSTQILTAGNNIVVLPNSYLAKVGLTNVSRPDETHQMVLSIRARPTRNPAMIADVMQQALIGANVIVQDPPPVVALQAIDGLALGIDVVFNVRHIADRIAAQNEIIDLIHRQCRAEGVALAPPVEGYFLTKNEAEGLDEPAALRELLRSTPPFSSLSADDLALLEAGATTRRYETGDALVSEADPLPIVRILQRGVVMSTRADAQPMRLSCGDIVGQILVDTDAPTFRALTPVDAFELDSDILAGILDREPRVLRDLSRRLSSTSSGPTGLARRIVHERWQTATFLQAVRSVLRKTQA